MRTANVLTTALLNASLLGACAGGGVPVEDGQGSGITDGKADGPGAGGDVAEVALPALAKRYSLAMTSTIDAKEIDSGEVTRATTVVTALVTVLGTEDPSIHDLEFGLCDVDLPEINGRKPTVEAEGLRKSAPAAARAQLQRIAAEVSETGEEIAPARVALVTERTALLLGVDPAEALTEELPSDDDDPRVIDLDEDGKPGLTIKVSGFKIYAGIRAKFGLEGAVDAAGVIAGEAGMEIDLAVFGDNIPFVNAARDLDEAADNTEVIAEEHAFTLTPVADDAGEVTCEQLPTAASLLSTEG